MSAVLMSTPRGAERGVAAGHSINLRLLTLAFTLFNSARMLRSGSARLNTIRGEIQIGYDLP